MKTHFKTTYLVAAVLLSLTVHRVKAAPSYFGAIDAAFSDPVLSGFSLDLNRNPVFTDNTATAVFSISNNTSSATYSTGDDAGGAGAPTVITFTGASFSGVAPDEVFKLGTITYTNGTNFINSLTFGATLSLSVNPTQSITPAISNFSLLTTTNGGISPFLDADSLVFPQLGVQFNIFEGATATASVYGRIVGDPQLQITGIQLDAGQAGNGFLSAVPETSSLPYGLAVFLVALFARVRVPRRSEEKCLSPVV